MEIIGALLVSRGEEPSPAWQGRRPHRDREHQPTQDKQVLMSYKEQIVVKYSKPPSNIV